MDAANTDQDLLTTSRKKQGYQKERAQGYCRKVGQNGPQDGDGNGCWLLQ